MEARLNNQLGSFQNKYDNLMNTRGATWYTNPDVSINHISEALRLFKQGATYQNKVKIIFYHHSLEELEIWLFDEDGIISNASVSLKKETLLQLENDLKFFIVNQNARGSNPVFLEGSLPSNFDSVTKTLSSKLLPKKICDFIDYEDHIIVIPCLNISSIPLYLLKPFDNDDYLVDRVGLTIAESIDHLLNKILYFRIKAFSSYSFSRNTFYPLFIGNPDFSSCSNTYNNLPGAEKEVIFWSNTFEKKPILNSKATKFNLLDEVTNSNFVYIATHGVSSKESPLDNSFLVFSEDEKSENDCSYLTASEIQKLKIYPETVVVLSACQSGTGMPMDAGVVGIGRAFILAGASSTIMSLWDIDDYGTMDFMKVFHDEMLIPQPFFPSENLRQAILKFKSSNSDPRVWASFICYGLPFPPHAKLSLIKP